MNQNIISNLEFVVDYHVLNSTSKLLIGVLLYQFIELIKNSKKKCLTDMELSIDMGTDNNLNSVSDKSVCKNCQIVLRYNCSAACITEGKCNPTGGVLTLHTKTLNKSNTYTYKTIFIIKIKDESYTNPSLRYVDNDKKDKIINTSNRAKSDAQYIVINTVAPKHKNVEMTGGIINDANDGAVNSQYNRINKLPDHISTEFVNNLKSFADANPDKNYVVVGGADSVSIDGRSSIGLGTDATVVKVEPGTNDNPSTNNNSNSFNKYWELIKSKSSEYWDQLTKGTQEVGDKIGDYFRNSTKPTFRNPTIKINQLRSNMRIITKSR